MRDAERERDELAAALAPLMGTLNFYIGPNARTAVGFDSVREYERLRLALRRAQGEPCHRCNDTGIDAEWKDGVARPCPLRREATHRIALPPVVIAYMREQRDSDRAADSQPAVDMPTEAEVEDAARILWRAGYSFMKHGGSTEQPEGGEEE